MTSIIRSAAMRSVALVCCVVLLLAVMLPGCAGSPAPTETGDSQPSSSQPVQTTAPSESTEATEPSTTTTPTETDPIVPPETTAPPETTSPTETTAPTETTGSTSDPGEMIGSLYTRAQLEALDSTSRGYGPGNTSDGKRPPYAVSDQQKYGKYGGNFIAPESSNVYLTFDCGYEYSFKDENGKTVRVTEWILDTLKEKNVKAVFFVTMPYCKSQPDLVQRMIDEGHAVGNHTNNHPSSLAELSIDDMVYEIMSLHEYVKEHFGYEMHLLRPPTGAFSPQSLAVAQSLGYKTVHWSFAYADWTPEKQPDIQSAYDTITSRHHGGAIYLLHAVSVTNATVLGDVIDFMRAQGYQLELFD